MGHLQINTTQNVNLNYKLVGIGERILAFLVDLFVLFLYAQLMFKIADLFNLFTYDGWTQRGLIGLMLLPAFTYSLWMQSIFNGRTLGKLLLKMRVVRLDGSPVHWSNYLTRWMLRFVDIWIFSGSIGVIAILFSDKKQRVGDAAAGTVVISTKNKTKISHTILEEIQADYTPLFNNVTLLNDRDVQIIKDTYSIAKKTRDFKTLNLLRVKVDSILNTNSTLYDKQYLDTVLKDYTYYTQGNG